MITIKSAVSQQQASGQVQGQTNATGMLGKLMNKKTLMIAGGILAVCLVGYIVWKNSKKSGENNASGASDVLDVSTVIPPVATV